MVEEESLEQARERMQKNLDKLLNYDRYSETCVEEVSEVQAVATEEVACQDEDIRPTSTTMQFGDGDLDQMYKEMNRKTEEKEAYALNSKGKIVAVLYSLVVAVILALIVLNTGVLARINNGNELKQAELNGLMTNYERVQESIDELSSDDYVSKLAEQEGMLKIN